MILLPQIEDKPPVRNRSGRELKPEQEQSREIMLWGRQILEQISSGNTLSEVIEISIAACESILENVKGSVFLLDAEGKSLENVIAPSLSEKFTKALIGEGIGPMAGSGGTAIYKKSRVICSDILNDPLWTVHKGLALSNNLRASWSTPIFHNKKVFGALNIYSDRVRFPTYFELHVVDYFVSLLENAIRQLPARHKEVDTLSMDQDEHEATLDRITIGCISLDLDWVLTYANKQACLILGRAPKDILNKNVWEEFPEAVGSSFHEAYLKANNEQKYVYLEEYYPVFEKWFSNHIYPTTKGISIFFEDVTERKLMEDTVQKSEKRYLQVLKTMMDGFVLMNPNGDIIKVNDAYLKMTGYTEPELLQMNILGLQQILNPKQLDERIQNVINGGPMKFESKHCHKNGSIIDVEVSVSVMEIGEQRYISCFVRNISDKKRNNELMVRQFHALEKYAHINAHEVRAKVATMLGLMNLHRENHVTSEERDRVFDLLYQETKGLDGVIRGLSSLINDQNIEL